MRVATSGSCDRCYKFQDTPAGHCHSGRVQSNPRRYVLTAAAAALWCLVLTPVQAYVFSLPERPAWLLPLDGQLRSIVDQAAGVFPHLDPYYIFGRLFFPAYLLVAYAFQWLYRTQRQLAGTVHNWLGKAFIGASALGGLGDAAFYWGGTNPEISEIGGVQLLGWVVEEFALLVMIVTVIGFGITTISAGVLPGWTGYLLAAGGLIAAPAGLITYIPHGLVLVLALTVFVVTALSPRGTRPWENRAPILTQKRPRGSASTPDGSL